MNKKIFCFVLCVLLLFTGCSSTGAINDTNATKEIYTHETVVYNTGTTISKEDITKETTQHSATNKETETSVESNTEVEVPTREYELPEVDFKTIDEEKGAYWLVNKIKDLGSSGSNYLLGFGSTTYTLVSAYLAANPNSRFDSSLKEVLAKSKEIYTTEVELRKIDDKYDYPIDKMYDYSLQSTEETFNVESKFEESYASGVLGWLNSQYDSIKNVGKRTTYYTTLNDGKNALLRPEKKLLDKGIRTFAVASVDEIIVIVDGFEKHYPVYYEISVESKKSISNDYEDSIKKQELLKQKKAELDLLLNKIQ